MKAENEYVVSYVTTFIVFTGLFQRQDPLIHVLNFELRRLCTVLLEQIALADCVNYHLAVGFESVDSGVEETFISISFISRVTFV